MPYDITKIPGIMRGKGWNKGAALMDGWFSRASNDVPARGQHDTTTITMSWALGFDRAREVYDTMISERVWANPPAQRAIADMLRDRAKLTGHETTFGGRLRDAQSIDGDYVQYRAVGSYWSDTYDDMLAALGRFVMRVAVKGRVTPHDGRHTIRLEEVGIYIRDSYDFNGDQSLGYWSDSDFEGGVSMFAGTLVTNGDFRGWRAANGRGGDYLVFSDVRVLRVTDTFDV